MPGPGFHKPRVLIVTGDRALEADLHALLEADFSIESTASGETLRRLLTDRSGTVLMIENRDINLATQMPDLAAAALAGNWRVIRLATDTGRYDSRWDRRVINLPLGVRPRVLLAAIRGLYHKRAGG